MAQSLTDVEEEDENLHEWKQPASRQTSHELYPEVIAITFNAYSNLIDFRDTPSVNNSRILLLLR